MSEADWKGMYWLCNEREQQLLKIKEAASRFLTCYDANYCWIENADENVSVALNDLEAAISAIPDEPDDE